jgi:hypothetical protein
VTGLVDVADRDAMATWLAEVELRPDSLGLDPIAGKAQQELTLSPPKVER